MLPDVVQINYMMVVVHFLYLFLPTTSRKKAVDDAAMWWYCSAEVQPQLWLLNLVVVPPQLWFWCLAMIVHNVLRMVEVVIVVLPHYLQCKQGTVCKEMKGC